MQCKHSTIIDVMRPLKTIYEECLMPWKNLEMKADVTIHKVPSETHGKRPPRGRGGARNQPQCTTTASGASSLPFYTSLYVLPKTSTMITLMVRHTQTQHTHGDHRAAEQGPAGLTGPRAAQASRSWSTWTPSPAAALAGPSPAA